LKPFKGFISLLFVLAALMVGGAGGSPQVGKSRVLLLTGH